MALDQPPGDAPLPLERFSTATVPAPAAFDRWRERFDALVDIRLPAAPSGPFSGVSVTSQVGAMALCLSRGDGMRSVRDAARIRRDQLDHYMIVMTREGELAGRAGERPFKVTAGVPTVISLAQPFTCERGAAEWLMLFVARDELAEWTDVLDDCVGQGLDGPVARLLALHLDAMANALPSLTMADARPCSDVTLGLLRAVLSARGRAGPHAHGPAPAVRAHLRQLIRAHLGSSRLDPARVARLAGLSRTQLYRVMEPEGGVARAIQVERLAAVRRALADPQERRPIWQVAEANGLHDASGFSRAFRREFGQTPREFRAEAARGVQFPPLPDAPGGSLRGLLHGLC